MKREIRLNKLIFHPNIARVYEMLETESTIFIMMEYIQGGELFEYIIGKRHLQEKEARHFFRQIISCIDYLHKVRDCNLVIHHMIRVQLCIEI